MKTARKRILSLILCFALLLPCGLLPAFAAGPTEEAAAPVRTAAASDLGSVFAEDENSLIVFVTGIGQSASYLFDERYLAPDAFESGTLQDYENYAPLIARGEYVHEWNLFANNFAETIREKENLKAAVRIVLQLLCTLFVRRNVVREEDIRTLVLGLFGYNTVDEQGNGDPRMVTPRYPMAVADYPGVTDENGRFTSEAKNRFYSSIPCADICREKLGADYEKYLYCYNFSPFSYTSKNVEGLHDFIETALENNRVGAEKVVLVPMSMGASVVSAHLAKYPQVGDNHVRRVVSIVGCWKGSDVIYDLVTKHYADNSADLFYNGIIGEMVGKPWGYLVNLALRLFSKQSLRDFIDEALGVFTEELLFDAPSLVALVPDDKYEEVRSLIPSAAVRAETDVYHEAQASLSERLPALEAQGVTFSFLAGYGLAFGAVTGDYKVFGFMRSAAATNSDEIIQVSSTVPGVEYAPWDGAFADPEGRELSPEGTLDVSGALYKDSSWFFYGQKHELEYDNNAIRLAIALALGRIKTVSDCADPNGEYYFPQFNGSRDIKRLTRDDLPALKRYLAAGGTLSAEQQALYTEVLAMIDSPVNDREKDDALQEEFRAMLVDLGVYEASASQPGFFDRAAEKILSGANDCAAKTVGSKGYLDFAVK